MHRTPRIRHLQSIDHEIFKLEYKRDHDENEVRKKSYQDLIDKLVNFKSGMK